MMSTSTTTYYAQFGEDAILEDIFRNSISRCCVEVGANDGVTDSMTYYFERKGWNCLLVEPIPELFDEIRRNRSCKVVNCAAASTNSEAIFYAADNTLGMSSMNPSKEHLEHIAKAGGTIRTITVRTKRLDDILAEADFQTMDFISIDVEGNELDVLKGFSIQKYNPRIVILEDNSNMVDTSIPTHMKKYGYSNFKRTGVNDWYARTSDVELAQPEVVAELLRKRKMARIEHRIIMAFSPINPYLPESIKISIRKLLAKLLGIG